MQLSNEQLLIIDKVTNNPNSNFSVRAVPGAGKTTVVLYIAEAIAEDKFIIQLTYNRRLADDVAKKIKNCNVSRLAVFTYHGLASKLLGYTIGTDEDLAQVLDKIAPPDHDLLVIDETQDMKPLYYQFVRKLCPKQVLVLGDDAQAVYEFMKSDRRFLTLAEQVWQAEPLIMSISYRVPAAIASFVNDKIRHDPTRVPIVANSAGGEVSIIIDNIWNPMKTVEYLTKLLQENDPDQIFILVPSIRGLKNSNSPISKLAGAVSRFPIYAPQNESESAKGNIVSNKIVITTFHQSKGLERDHVIIFGFDDSYTTYHDRSGSNICPAPLFVAMTRARKTLTLIQGKDRKPIPYLIGEAGAATAGVRVKDEAFVTWIRFLPQVDGLQELFDKLFVRVSEAVYKRFIVGSITVTYDKFVIEEDVSNINGNAIPLYWVKNYLCGKTVNIADTLRYVIKDDYKHRSRQITTFDWLDSFDIDECCDELHKTVMDRCRKHDGELEFAVQLSTDQATLHGRVDLWVPAISVGWEFKCTGVLSFDHKLQTLLNMVALGKEDRSVEMHLLNVLTGEHYVACDFDLAWRAWEMIKKAKNEVGKVATDEEFLQFNHF